MSKKTSITWTENRDPYPNNWHGYRASIENRSVEVVLCYSACGSWDWFAYVDGSMVRKGPIPPTSPHYVSYHIAKAAAAHFLRTGEINDPRYSDVRP